MPIPLAAVGIGLGAVSLVSGFLSSRSAQKAARREEERRQQLLNRIKKAASPENFQKIFNTLRPIFREAAIQTIAPTVESTVATQLGRRDLTGTGLGQVLTGLAPAVAGAEGLRGAQSQAGILQQNEIAALSSGLPTGFGVQSQIQDPRDPFGALASGTSQLIADIRGLPGLQNNQAGQQFLQNTINQGFNPPGTTASPLFPTSGQQSVLLPHQQNDFR